MTTQRLPGTEAARHGAGDADLTVMLAAHDAFRRDLVSLARAAAAADRADPARREQVGPGVAGVQAPAALAPHRRGPAHLA